MSNYTKTTNFGAKDTLPSGDSQKIIRGTEFDTEFNNVATAIATKLEVDGSNNLAISGTFSSTKLIPTGGTATGNGMYLPAANTVALSTNGTERVRVDSSGNLGVGRTPSGSAIVDVQNDANAIIRVRGGAGSNEGSAFYGVSGSDTTRFAFGQVSRILGGTPNDDAVVYAAGYLAFAAAGTERARIDASGNLGVGTTVGAASGTGLIIYSPTSTRLQLRNSTTGDTAGDGCGLLAFGSDLYVENRENGATLFFNNGSERARIDSSGNLGIGTTSPGSRLDVQSASSANAYRVANIYNSAATGTTAGSNVLLRVASNGSGADSTLVLTDSTSTNGFISNNNGNLLFGNGLGFTERMRLDSSGNLGIGTTSPGVKLQVVGTISSQFAADGSNASGVRLIPATTGEQAVRFITSDGNSRAAITGADVGGGPGVMRFYVNNPSAALTEYMRLDASGNLGIGTSSPAYQLDVVGNIRLTNATGIYFNNSSGTAKTILQYFSDNNTYLDSPDGSILFRTGSGTVERMRLKSTGQFRFVPLSSDPSGAESGDVYYNSTSNKLKVYNGTSWVDLH